MTVQAPANANLAPPGDYMLFLVNTNGVPSVASFVRVAAAADTDAADRADEPRRERRRPARSRSTWTASTDTGGVTRYNVHRVDDGRLHADRREPDRAADRNQLHRHRPRCRHLLLQGHRRGRRAGNVGPASNEASATVAGDTTAPAAPTALAATAGVGLASTHLDRRDRQRRRRPLQRPPRHDDGLHAVGGEPGRDSRPARASPARSMAARTA